MYDNPPWERKPWEQKPWESPSQSEFPWFLALAVALAMLLFAFHEHVLDALALFSLILRMYL